MRRWCAVLCVLALCTAGAVQAGRSCEQRPATPQEVAIGTRTALNVLQALQQSDAQVALLARAGTDLSRYDLKYSHIAVIVKDHPSGPWTVIHMLNHCGRADSNLFDQGLVNFFTDDMYRFNSMIVMLNQATQRALLKALDDGVETELYEPRYNMIAHPYSMDFQNSNQWLLELVAVVVHGTPASRAAAHHALKQTGYQPDRIRIGRLKRIIGDITQPNLSFTDHPLSSRIRSRYDVVTVRSVVNWLVDQGVVSEVVELEAPLD